MLYQGWIIVNDRATFESDGSWLLIHQYWADIKLFRLTFMQYSVETYIVYGRLFVNGSEIIQFKLI